MLWQRKMSRKARRPPRIGIDVTSAVTQGGGIGRYTRELVRALVDLDQEYDYRLFSARQPAELPVPDPIPRGPNVDYRQMPLSERWLYRLWYRLRIPLPVQKRTGELDLFHSPDFVLPPVSGGIPTLLTVHDLSFVHYSYTFTPALTKYLNRVVPWSVSRAEHILADSEATRNDLLAVWKVHPDKVSVLYSGVDQMFAPVTDKKVLLRVRQKYNLGDRPYLFSTGTVQPRKNYQMLIRAFASAAEVYPHNLVIAGRMGWMYEQVIAEVTRQGLDGRVMFLGFVADDDLPALYSDAELFVFPSLYEGFGLPLLEAMACGVTVLSSDASCLPEVAGDAALLLPPQGEKQWSDAMQTLLAEPINRTKLVAAGFRRARQFRWKKSAKQLLGIYERLLDRNETRVYD